MREKATWMVALSVFMVLQIGLVQAGPSATQSSEGPKKPLPIIQGTWQTLSSPAGDPSPCTPPFCYWFQVGAQSNSATSNSVGVNVTIRTVFDQVNQDAHSYWVGSILANNAFIQVGYLNGLSTNNQPYCCAWFYEFFPSGNNNSPPVIGAEGSAGSIGSWHSYSMVHVGNGVWHFYMDGKYLGSTPSPGQPNYLGSGATSTSSSSFPAAIAEVAQASTNLDVIGPAEFKNLTFTTGSGWQPVQVGVAHIGYGATSLTSLPNPYGVAAIYNTSGDFLAGSNIPQPAKNSQLWPTTLPLFYTQLSFSFVDMDGGQIQPTWISLKDGNTLIFYSSYQSQIVPTPNSSNYTVYQAIWHAVNVATGLRISPSGSVQSIPVNVFSVSFQVVGLFYSIPVSGATLLAPLPDSTSETATTDVNGRAVLTQLPPSTYTLHTTVPHSIAATSSQNIQGPSSIVLKVFSLLELVTVIVGAIILALAAVALAWRKEKARQMAAVPSIAAPGLVPTNCARCGQPLPQGVNFCPNCGTPLRTTIV